ncbi:hypothetical protein A2823_01705 [Candidatus Nomurabacteria bacterium RIFCSPHIGHO2_01_FULL_41_91]|nr:MAG: hypothetical protein A2823_01705 [Candidatus Nomurabacteria bacterium RIFCSPHIGHO2_01_FULL_41_91]OGI80255.1 MAG: hypothetical protein A3D43_01090 [Candidatus Nomurabacteria bacterium RIFCSPHIGHO2_02_FULL_41_52]OGI85011.1 MAG: hypothetical protein A3F49_00685 [Candidatus Nomurabacteria bacterium RIFCSPHIGHO2_12_FULL_42_19]
MKNTELTIQEALRILDTASDFHLGAEKVLRFVGDPNVDGDNIAEHTARAMRLAVYAMPFILVEFAGDPEIKNLAENIYATILVHDDEEIEQGFDIISPKKKHNVRDEEEIELVNKKMKKLPAASRHYVINLFSAFRKRNTLASKIAKVFDNLSGNQVVLEQKLSIVGPDAARFTVYFIDRTRGASKITDLLINAQIKQVLEYREFSKNNISEIKMLAKKVITQEGCKLSISELEKLIKKLLNIEVLSHPLNKEKVSMKIWEYQ